MQIQGLRTDVILITDFRTNNIEYFDILSGNNVNMFVAQNSFDVKSFRYTWGNQATNTSTAGAFHSLPCNISRL